MAMSTPANRNTTTTSAPAATACWLSVVIPTHNRRQLVLRAVGSVLAQAGGAWHGTGDATRSIEIIVVDDGSDDGTADTLRQQYGDDRRVQVIRTAHLYTCAARNTGFRASCGEWVCFLDSDDVWDGHVLNTVAQVLERHPELVLLSIDGSTLATAQAPSMPRIVADDCPGWSHAAFHKAPLTCESLLLDGQAEASKLLHGDYFPAIINADLFYLSGLFMRREAIVRAGPFNERFRYYNDWEFFARLCLQGPGAYLDVEGFRRDHGRADQISRGRPSTAMPRRHLYILRSLPRQFPAQTRRYADHLREQLVDAQYWMGRCLLRAKQARRARPYLRRSIGLGYKRGRSLVLLAKTFLP